jgi:DNA-binding transcriptional ArsR family regulator
MFDASSSLFCLCADPSLGQKYNNGRSHSPSCYGIRTIRGPAPTDKHCRKRGCAGFRFGLSTDLRYIRVLRNNVRTMRKTIPLLDSLFPTVRQGVLAAALTRPEKWWYLSELADFLQTRPSSLQRELSSLKQTGILQQRKDGRRTYYRAETRSPIFRVISTRAWALPHFRSSP